MTRSHVLWASLVAAIAVTCIVALSAVARPAVAQAAVAKGIADPNIVFMSSADQQPVLDEIKATGSPYVRLFASWALAVPGATPPADPTQQIDWTSPYNQQVESAITYATGIGLKVIITFQQVPRWASDNSFWKDWGDQYQPFIAMSQDGLLSYGAFVEQFATHFAGKVYAYECWNEPNLRAYFYPQKTSRDPNFAPDLYYNMLRQFSKAIQDSGCGALRVGGATAPRGNKVPYNTPPQVFAARLKALGADAYFDVYSHHPYTPGATKNTSPTAPPRDPSTTVSIQNLSTLIRIFPHKYFWLTEYGYQTAPCRDFAYQYVDQITQATDLRIAYAYVAAHYPRVRMLLWFLMRDTPAKPPLPAEYGFYTGLDTTKAAHKRAWFAFAGVNSTCNHLSVKAPASVRRGAAVRLSGALRCLESAAGRPLVLQSHTVGKQWVNGRSFKTNSVGGFGLTGVKPKATTWYRVSWLGIVSSASVRVTVR